MNEMINWVTRHNTLMIQSGFTIVLLLVIVYIYRLFFITSHSQQAAEGSAEVNQLNEKIDQLLQQQKEVAQSPLAGAATTSSNELERLRGEVQNLRAALNESEKKVFDMAPTGRDASAMVTGLGMSVASDPAQTAEWTQKIEQLEARLAEYDIIAEDIAELSQLRAENTKLKQKFNVTEEMSGSLETSDQPSVISETLDEPVSAALDEPMEPFPELEAMVEPELLPTEPEAEEETKKAISETEVASVVMAVVATPPSSSEISDADKNIMNEFEKIAKRSSS